MIALLLERGAIVDAPDKHGNTPLNRAVYNSKGRGEVIALLRAAGANATLNNRYGISPLSMALTISNYNVRQFFVDLDD